MDSTIRITKIRRALDVLGSGDWRTFDEMVGSGDLWGRAILRGGLPSSVSRGLVESRARSWDRARPIEYRITERGAGAVGRWI